MSKTRARLLVGDVPEWIAKHPRAKRLIEVRLARPPWVRSRDFKALYAEAKWQSAMHNEPWVLDHIVPISHPLVCGLDVPWNIQVVPQRTNFAKSNWWTPDQVEMDFATPRSTSVSSPTPKSQRGTEVVGDGSGRRTGTTTPRSTYGFLG